MPLAPRPRPVVAVVALGDTTHRDDGLALRVMGRVRTLVGEVGCTRSVNGRSGGAEEKFRRRGSRSGGASPAGPSFSQWGREPRASRRRERGQAGAASILVAARGNPGQIIEWIEGGTDPRKLDPMLAGRRRVILLDAVTLGSKPGTVHHWHMECKPDSRMSVIHHYNGKSEVGLKHLALWLEDELPQNGTDLIGIEPYDLTEGGDLSRPIQGKLPAICSQVAALLIRILDEEGW